MIRLLGTGEMMGYMWGLKTAIEGLPFSFAPVICDKLMHKMNNWIPSAIPNKFKVLGQQYDHNCIVTVGEFGDGTLDRFMDRFNAFLQKYNEEQLKKGGKVISYAETSGVSEVTALNAFRFVAAPAFKIYCVGEDVQGVSVDYALAKNGGMPPPLSTDAVTPLKRMRYSHFGCNVVHEDIAYALGVDTHKEKMSFKRSVEAEGGKLPAEHGHGTEYHAPKNTKARWMKMDPLNVMNPGVGGLETTEKYTK